MTDRFDRQTESSIHKAEHQGEFKKLKGHGKPISREYLEGDTFNGILKNANYIPPWLEMQHEIRDDIKAVINDKQNIAESSIDREIEAINEKIKRYNRMCPAPSLQKMRIFKESIEKQYNKWK